MGALDGMLVVAFEQAVAAPLCTVRLADAGARVIKIERREGDLARHYDTAVDGMSAYFAWLNRGKESLVLDIKAEPDIGHFIADGRRVRQILYNLLSNAIGFSPPSETITLAAERREDAVRFSVTDRGPGIPADIQDRVFNRFETHSLGSGHRGTGLGLSIVRSFVELHGGTVTLDSAVGRGTTVVCVFPLETVVERVAAE